MERVSEQNKKTILNVRFYSLCMKNMKHSSKASLMALKKLLEKCSSEKLLT